jgi:hypothetical protein
MESTPLASLTHDDFERRVGEPFRLTRDGDAGPGTLELRLLRVDAAPVRDRLPRARTPFSLVLVGPGDPVLPQKIYRLENESLGRVDIFLVPIARDERGVRYEAVFS